MLTKLHICSISITYIAKCHNSVFMTALSLQIATPRPPTDY